MKNYIVSIIPNLKKYSRKLNDISLLTQDGWALIDSSPSKSKIYYFKSDNELLITYRGKVKHGSWEIIHNNIVIKEDGGSFIFKLDFNKSSKNSMGKIRIMDMSIIWIHPV